MCRNASSVPSRSRFPSRRKALLRLCRKSPYKHLPCPLSIPILTQVKVPVGRYSHLDVNFCLRGSRFPSGQIRSNDYAKVPLTRGILGGCLWVQISQSVHVRVGTCLSRDSKILTYRSVDYRQSPYQVRSSIMENRPTTQSSLLPFDSLSVGLVPVGRDSHLDVRLSIMENRHYKHLPCSLSIPFQCGFWSL